MLNCGPCFNVTIPACAEQWLVHANLTPTTEYIVAITDKFGAKYNINITTDANGAFALDPADATLPPQFFNAYSGSFTIEVYKQLGCDVQTMTFCTVEYTCINITMTEGVTYDLFDIGCCGDEIAGITNCEGDSPSVSVTSNSPACAGSTLTLFVNFIDGDVNTGCTYKWTGPNDFTSTTQNPVINSVLREAEGVYTVEVTRDNCTTILQKLIRVSEPITGMSEVSNTPATIGNSDGSFRVAAAGGTAPFTYSIMSGAVENQTGLFTDLPAGDYAVHVIDVNGCTVDDLQVTLTEA